jgi:glutamate 5-kinase
VKNPVKKSSKRTKWIRWVVKVGSNAICEGGPLLIRAWMQQIAELRKKHHIEVVWVTSGAIASAVERTGFSKVKRSLPEKQALSAIGQPLLMELYNLSLQAAGLVGAQILLTYEDMAEEKRKNNLQNTLEKLLAWEAVPLLNENDAVATEEIKFGDNDSLSAKVACMMRADRLIILSDVEGLYDSPPQKDPNASLIRKINRVTDDLLKRLENSGGSRHGTGGMYSKVLAAKEATSQGIATWVVRGEVPNVLVKLARNEPLGTQFGGS